MNQSFDGQKVWNALQKYRYALLVLLVGAVLLMWPAGKEQRTAPMTAPSSLESDSFDLSELEKRMAQTLSSIQGVGRAEVVLTLQSGSRKVLAEDIDVQQDSARNSTLILSTGSGTESTVTTQVLYPVFQGALVVCDGGGNARVRLEVLRAVEALTGLKADHISVSERQGDSK